MLEKKIKENNNKIIINEEIETVLSWVIIAILLSDNAYDLIKNVLDDTSDINTIKSKVNNILDKVFPGWSKDKKINAIAKKLSKIPEIIEFIKNPNKKETIIKYLRKNEYNYINYIIKLHKLREYIGKQVKIL